MKRLLNSLLDGKKLSLREAEAAMRLILEGDATNEQIAGFLFALQCRGETAEELEGFLNVLRAKSVKLPVSRDGIFDTCGTGGDNAETFNISTVAALLLASLGVPVAKHGNRSVSSRSGSADVLEALSIPIDLSPAEAARQIETGGFAFLFAPSYHPSLARVTPIRRALGTRTVFNALGPLANPAGVRHQILGVYDERLIPHFAEVLKRTGTIEAMVVASTDGLDEFSLAAPTRVAHLKKGRVELKQLEPKDFGLERADAPAIRGGDSATNAIIARNILSGEDRGPRRDIVLMNVAAALLVAGKARDLRDGVGLALDGVRSGRAAAFLERLTASSAPTVSKVMLG